MKKIMTKLFVIFLILQPILDLQIFYEDKTQLFSFSISTILRILMTIILLIMVVVSKKTLKKNKLFIIYFCLITIYYICHIINCNNFEGNITSTFNFSIMSELFYLIRMTIPISLIYIMKNLEIDNHNFKKIILINVFIYSFVIILSSIFAFGYQSYGNNRITYSLIDWFTKNVATTINSGTRGLFAGTNRTSILFAGLLPLTYYFYYKEKGNKLLLLIFLQIVASIILCTRVGSYSWIIVSIIMLLLYIIFNAKKINKSKIIYTIFIVASCSIILSFSPIKNRVYGSDMKDDFDKIYKEKGYADVLKKYNTDGFAYPLDDDYDEKINFIKNEYLNFYIRPLYIENIYNYNMDPNFWLNLMKMPYHKRDDDRKIQLYISERIYELNNNVFDKYLGMGHSTFKSSDLYLERDIVVHFFTIGIIGIIMFFGPYIITPIYSLYFILTNIKKNCTFKLMSLNFSLCVMLLGSVMTGHILDEMITYIFIAIIIVMIINEIKWIKDREKKFLPEKVSIIIPIYNVEEYLDECLQSIINQIYPQEYIEVIMIDDCSTDKSKEIAKKYANKYNNFILIENTQNSGQAISRNIGIERSTGKYIVFLDSDDKLYPECILRLYNEIALTQSDLVVARINSYDTKGEYGYYSDKYINEYVCTNIYENKKLINCISICSKIYNRDIIKNIKFLENTIHEDNSYTLTTLFKVNKITILPEYLYYRRIREGENKSTMQKLNYKTYTDLIKNYNTSINNIDSDKDRSFLYLYMIKKLNNEIVKHVEKEKIEFARKEIVLFIENLKISNFKKKIYKLYDFCYKKIINIYIVVRGGI